MAQVGNGAKYSFFFDYYFLVLQKHIWLLSTVLLPSDYLVSHLPDLCHILKIFDDCNYTITSNFLQLLRLRGAFCIQIQKNTKVGHFCIFFDEFMNVLENTFVKLTTYIDAPVSGRNLEKNGRAVIIYIDVHWTCIVKKSLLNHFRISLRLCNRQRSV